MRHRVERRVGGSGPGPDRLTGKATHHDAGRLTVTPTSVALGYRELAERQLVRMGHRHARTLPTTASSAKDGIRVQSGASLMYQGVAAIDP